MGGLGAHERAVEVCMPAERPPEAGVDSEERAIAEPTCLAARGVANHKAPRARRVAQQLQHACQQPNQNTLSRSADR